MRQRALVSMLVLGLGAIGLRAESQGTEGSTDLVLVSSEPESQPISDPASHGKAQPLSGAEPTKHQLSVLWATSPKVQLALATAQKNPPIPSDLAIAVATTTKPNVPVRCSVQSAPTFGETDDKSGTSSVNTVDSDKRSVAVEHPPAYGLLQALKESSL